jgi:hypothetical protein
VDWRIKSRAVWIELGDENMKYFHHFANHRKNHNTIWELQNIDKEPSLHRGWEGSLRTLNEEKQLKQLAQDYKYCKAMPRICQEHDGITPVFTEATQDIQNSK